MLSVQNVRKTFSKRDVLQGVSFEVKATEILTILGPSGSGKSTLLRIIAGLESLDRGQVFINGKNVISEAPEARKVGLVLQDPLLFPRQTVRDNILFPLKMLGVGRSEREEKLSWALGVVRLEESEFAKKYPSQLSGGEAQRVALARGLVGRPDVVLLDEPLANLDRVLRKELEIEIREIQRIMERPFIHVTHNQEEALTISDRLIVLRNGSIEQQGSGEAVYLNPRNPFVAFFLGNSNRFDGEVLEMGDELAVLRWEGNDLRVPALKGMDLGNKLSFFLKQEKVGVRLSDEQVPTAAAENSIEGVIQDTVFKGQNWDIIISIGGNGRIVATLGDGRGLMFSKGDRVIAYWKASDGHSFERPDMDLKREVD